MKKHTEPKLSEQIYQCRYKISATARFTEKHCVKDCEWLVYGHVNIFTANHIGVCCASREVLELDNRNNEFNRTANCIEVVRYEPQ